MEQRLGELHTIVKLHGRPTRTDGDLELELEGAWPAVPVAHSLSLNESKRSAANVAARTEIVSTCHGV